MTHASRGGISGGRSGHSSSLEHSVGRRYLEWRKGGFLEYSRIFGRERQLKIPTHGERLALAKGVIATGVDKRCGRSHNFSCICQYSLYNAIMDTPFAVGALSALAHESRLTVFRLLVEAGPEGLAAGIIAERLGVAPNALSFHLKDLAHAQLVSLRHEGRRIYYSAEFETMNGLLRYLTDNCCQGSGCSTSMQAKSNCCS